MTKPMIQWYITYTVVAPDEEVVIKDGVTSVWGQTELVAGTRLRMYLASSHGIDETYKVIIERIDEIV